MTGLAWNGPLARTVRDAAALLDAMAVPMPGDPHWAPPLTGGATFLSQAGRDPGRLRIGRYVTPIVEGSEVHPDCLAAYEAATRVLTDLGHEVEDVDAPFPTEAIGVFETVWAASAASAPVDPAREAELLPLTRWLRERGAGITGAQFVGAVSQLQMLSRQWITRTAGYDAMLSPTLASPPAPVGWFTETGDPAEDFLRQERFTPFTAIYNVTGQPAVSVPLHWTDGDPTLPDRGDAGRPARRRGDAGVTVGAAGGRRAVGRATPARLVSPDVNALVGFATVTG